MSKFWRMVLCKERDGLIQARQYFDIGHSLFDIRYSLRTPNSNLLTPNY